MGKQATGQPKADPGWRWVSERGLRVATGATTLERYLFLVSQNLPEVEDLIPSDNSILLILHRGAPVSKALRAALAPPLAEAAIQPGPLHEIAVEYGGAAGPDLPGLARRAGISVADCIERHAAADYTVAFLGFQPGFPYLRGLPDVLCAPRRATPRVRVAAGSVAIGGAYCGIYPAAGPGGWQLIGRAAAVLFDPARAAPALLLPGDRVRFVPE
ncbi:MAG: 5-oxoprolinase subunit PxpB [Thiobacillus sp.]|nr:5-oxoprolinase subunit PxpB [Thiobacillus sp.]